MPGDFTRSRSFPFPKRVNRWQGAKNFLNKPNNKNDQLRGQKATGPLQEPLPTEQQMGRAEAGQTRRQSNYSKPTEHTSL